MNTANTDTDSTGADNTSMDRETSERHAQRALALSIALSERDKGTSIHCDRVTGLSLEIGAQHGLPDRELQVLRLAAVLHDIGKIGIPDNVLLKPGKLTADEWEVMKAHSIKDHHIALALNHPDAETLAWVVRHHHERYDGSGYPDGLAGDSIPLLARIIALADCYDAMAEDRMYHRGRTHREIMEILAEGRGTHHSPEQLDAFSAVIETSAFRARLA
jgi:HD-GYP domain-containing protein (c-di-GMP phosphodiesterase class II)